MSGQHWRPHGAHARALVPARRPLLIISSDMALTCARQTTFHLNWEFMKTFSPTRVYAADWPLLDSRHFPALRRDIAASRKLWPRRARVREALWVGPSLTVSGLHMHPAKDVLSCQARARQEALTHAALLVSRRPPTHAQVRGVKEWLLFGAEQSALMRPTDKCAVPICCAMHLPALCSRISHAHRTTRCAFTRC